MTVPSALVAARTLAPRLRLLTAAGACSWLMVGAPRSALGQAPADSVTASAPSEDERLPAYHHSLFYWDHSVTTATLGVGDTPQSYNPTYTMGFVAKTRYYLLDDTPAGKHFSLRLDTGLYREFTDSDVTTQRGEWSMSDSDLAAVYTQRFQGPSDTDGTSWEVRPLTLTLPTSKASYDSGRYFAPGAAVGVINVTPWLRGRVRPKLASTVRLAVGYKRWFARATVPTNPSLERVRLTPEGRTSPGDTLSGSSLVRDQVELTARVRLELGENVLWTTDAAVAPAWKYDVQQDLQLCGVVLTGCANVQVSPNDSRYMVRTHFTTDISVRIAPSLAIGVGYGNSAAQLGADGRRRGFFYSPEATFFTYLSFMPHELVTGPQRVAESATVPSTL